MPIQFVPAIELVGGKVVARDQGTVYSDDPARTTTVWRFEGAPLVHVVDLESSRQMQAIRSVVEAARNVPVQLEGGLGDFASIESAFALGVSRVVVDDSADRTLLSNVIQKFGVQRVAVATGDVNRAKSVVEAGVKVLVHRANDVEALRRLCDAVAPLGAFVLRDGGVETVEDLIALRRAEIPNVVGVIAARPLYERAFTLPQARRALEGPLK